MNAEQIRKLPVGDVLDLLEAGVYMEIGNFRIHGDDHYMNPFVHVLIWDGESWIGEGAHFNLNIDGVAEMLISFAERMEAQDAQK